MNDDSDLARPVTMTLYQVDTDLLDDVGRDLDLRTRSAVARFIFWDWMSLKAAAIRAAAPLDVAEMAIGTYHEPLADLA